MNGEWIHPDDDVLGLTEAYVHGLLSDEQVRYVDAQVAASATWRAALDEARARAVALASVPAKEPSEALITRALESARVRQRRGTRTRRVFTRVLPAMFAAAAAVLLCMHLYFQMLTPGGYDLTVLGQSTLSAGGPASLRIRLFDRAADRPVAGAPVEVSLSARDGQRITLAKFTTDAQGTGSPRYTLPDWTEGEYTLHVTASNRETIDRTVTLKRPTRLMLSTDKPVYQPGQTIHMRTLALRRADGKPMTGQEAVFTIADPKGTIIFKKRGVTSAFGITSADCPLADEIIHGNYTLTCTVAGTESQRTVDVRPYTLPKFRVDVNIDEPFLRPGQVVRAGITASYFFGQPVAGGAVSVEMSAPDAGITQTQSITLDQQGQGRVEFRLPDRLIGTQRDSDDARLAFTATVTDTGNQSEARTVARIVSASDLRIEILPESGTLIPGVPNRIYALITTPDGRPAPHARLAIAGLGRELTTSELGVATFDITPAPLASKEFPGEERVTITATDTAGRTASRTVQLSSRAVSGDFLLRTDAAAYASGGTLLVSVMGAGTEPVFVDLLKDGQTVLTQLVTVKDGHGELAIDLPHDLSGTLELAAYRFDPSGIAARRTRTVVVQGADDLRVAVTPDKPQYRPGEQAKLRLDVTDSGGKPAPGAVSIAAVDEAVYSVLDQAPGMERTLLALDEQLLKPVYTLYPWTALPKATGQQRDLDLALFSATTTERTLDRKAFFQKLIDDGAISEDMLQVLDSPRAERMIADMQAFGAISPEAADILRGSGASAVHSLNGSTWPEKELRVQQRRHDGRQLVAAGWVIFVISLVLCLLAAACYFIGSRIIGVLVVICLLGMMCFALLPSLGKARSSARQMRDQTMLRGLGNALDIAGATPTAAPVAQGNSPPRVRQWFPETLLWRPEVITDDVGHASVEVDLADSITTWRIFGGAVTRDGRLGSLNGQLSVFQPFFVDINAPSHLTRLDEASIPLVVYNYLDTEQRITLTVKRADWFDLIGDAEQTITLPPKAVRSASVRVRALRAGVHDLETTAIAENTGNAADAIRRTIEVLPGGRAIESVSAGSLASPLQADIDVPADVIDGSGRLFIKVYPSPLSQFVEGMEGIFQAPHGCFEQTSSTTYPNVLALEYLKRTGKAVPTVEATARQYIHLGYQRLISFEVPGGGFDWFGHPPANRLLTAYGLMEFIDMGKVHDVDVALINRTRQWLMAQRRPDGSWAAENHGLASGVMSRTSADADVITTAYIAWSVFTGAGSPDAGATRAWLERRPADQSDPYTVALMVHAISASGGNERPWMTRLMELRQSTADAKQSWWSRPEGARTAFYGSGRFADVETTALATLALLQHKGDLAATRGGVEWLIAQRDSHGTWGTTQSTVLALRALVAASDAPLGDPVQRVIAIDVDGRTVERITIDPDQAEVLKQRDLSGLITPGRHRITLHQERGPASQAQIVFRAAVPGAPAPSQPENDQLAVDVRYDRNVLRVGEELHATATLKTTSPDALPMVMLDLPIPPGFEPARPTFDAMIAAGSIARYEITPRTVIVYLTALRPGQTLELNYAMRATMPVTVQAPRPTAYEYYNPHRRASGTEASLKVEPALN